MNGFWHQGRENLLKELKKQEAEEFAGLESELANVETAEDALKIQERMIILRKDYEAKKRAIASSLFVSQ